MVVVVIVFVVGASGTLVWRLVVGMPKQNTNIIKYMLYGMIYVRFTEYYDKALY